MVAVASYILAILIPWPASAPGRSGALLVASVWPILSIVYCHGLANYIAVERDGTANRLAFLFAVAGFTIVLAMIVVQLAVNGAIGEITAGLDPSTTRAIRRGLRMIDLGLDVAWDMLIGTALVFLGVAMGRRGGLGPAWAIPSAILGIALIALNAATFPWPPGDHGLVDIGPFVGIFVMALAARLAMLGRGQARRAGRTP
jgi:hypothetical protein